VPAAATTLQAAPAADAKQRYSRIVPAKQQAAEIRARVADGWMSGGLLYLDGGPPGHRPACTAPPAAPPSAHARLSHSQPATFCVLRAAARRAGC
jgi:hypothetical protein